jgi:broad-specificity NMP kinase
MSSRVLITGMSGTGKSAALVELGRRGYRVVDTDDPGWREYHACAEPTDETHRGEWLWVEDRMAALLDSDDGRSLFVQGCVRNQWRFYDRFDAVVLLSAPADVILDRVARRATNSYGKTPLERAMISMTSQTWSPSSERPARTSSTLADRSTRSSPT